MDFNATGQLLIMYSACVKYLRKNGNTLMQLISYLYRSRKTVIRLGGRGEFGGGGRGMDSIDLAQDSERWRVLVKAAMNLRVPQNAGNFLTS